MGLFSKKPKDIEISTPPATKSGDEYAQVIDWIPKWDAGAPMPQVFSNGRKTYLIYFIDEPDPNWDGTYVTVIDNTSDTVYPLALVEFDGTDFKFGIANDEVFSGLPLWNKGLEYYRAHIVENSNWLEELKSIHKVHPYFKEERWTNLKHYVLLFHDELLEVMAEGYKVEIFKTTFETLAVEVVKRMNN